MGLPVGKYVHIDLDDPDAQAICDRSGFRFLKRDLVKQMEWRGNSLEWTGYLVGYPFVDIPNEQQRNPILLQDPIPVKDPRLMQNTDYVWNTIPYTFSNCPYTFNNVPGIFNGVPYGSIEAARLELENIHWGSS
ncbi:MAG TPA: hypothetical protein VHA52_09970 [Candidatus Babeliaceae bacterium]|nr:hypothetical protein [Candidatus Babeliaceae bacterium]